MVWEIDPAVRYIQGAVTSYIKSKTAGLNEIEFDLHNDLTIDSIVQHQQKINFSHAENKITIQLNEPLQLDELDSLTVFYQGIPPESVNGFGAFANETHSNNPEIPIIWTLSEPYGALEWWPCKQSLKDKIDSIDIIVTSPEPYRTASNGILLSENVSENKRIMHWRHRHPIATYLVAIAVTNYVDYSDFLELDNGRQIEILNFVYPESLESLRNHSAATVDIMQLFNELIGEYPFADEKYGHAQFGWGGGMEHQTMSFMYNFNFELVAHELAHQWFGNYITLGSWQDIWLNEGFATYLSGLAYENLLDGVWWPRWKKLVVNRITSSPNGSVFVQDTTSVSRIFNGRLSYSKGAYLLHMLRWILGNEAFFQGLKNYFNDPAVANGFARNEQFVNHLEIAGDTSLTEFFNDWYYGEGYPVYSLQYSPSADGKYSIKLAQTTSHNSVNFFEMPVPLRIYNATKTDSMDIRLYHTQNNQEFLVETEFEIGEVKIDPDYWLISKTSEILFSPNTQQSEEIRIFPNPFTQEIHIFLPSGERLLKTEIFDTTGTKLAGFGSNKKKLNLSSLPAGVYFVRVSLPNKKYMEKLIKF
jgi:aminopeptidase N